MKRKLLFTIVVALVAAMVCWLPQRKGSRAKGPLPNDCYIWQRAWTERVSDAVAEYGTNFSQLMPLAAEVSWKRKSPQVVRVPLNLSVLLETGRRIGLA